MDEIINLLDRVCQTMESISVVGTDNQDKFVGCAHAVQTAASCLKQLAEQEREKAAAGAKEDTPDG